MSFTKKFKWQLVLVALGASLVLTGKAYSQEIANSDFQAPAASVGSNFNTTNAATANTAATVPQQPYTSAAGSAIRVTNEMSELESASLPLTAGTLLAIAIIALVCVIVKKVSSKRQNNWKSPWNSSSARKTQLIPNKSQALQS